MKFFFNQQNFQNGQYDFIRTAIKGTWGFYSKGQFGKTTQNKNEKEGFQLIDIDKLEAATYQAEQNDRLNAIHASMRSDKLGKRYNQVSICLSAAPVPMQVNHSNGWFDVIIELANTPLINAYNGCGYGTAYFNSKKELVAWHYGYEAPDNSPRNCTAVKCELSCTELLVSGANSESIFQ